MYQPSLLLLLLPLVALAATPTWVQTIPNGHPGNPLVREFQSLTNVPGTSLSILFSGVTYNSTTFNPQDTWILDTSVPSWKSANPPSHPPGRGYAVAGATPTELILYGGHNEGSGFAFYGDVWRYFYSSNVWRQDNFSNPLNYLHLQRSFHAGVLVGDTLYIFGGYVAPLQTSTNDVWSYNLTSKNWTQLVPNGRPGSPPPRQGHSAVYYNDTSYGPSIIFFGGYNGTGGRSDTWQYIIATNTFVQLTKDGDPSGPAPRWGHSAVLVINGSIPAVIIFGGSFVGGPVNPYYNDVWKLSLNGTTWGWTDLLKDGNSLGPWKRAGHSTVVSNGRLFTFGGYGQFVGLYNDLWELTNY